MKENHILAKWLSNDLSENELAAFEASPDFEKYQKIKNYTAHLEVGDWDENAMLERVLQQKKNNPKIVSLYKKWIFKVAAVLVLAFGITFAIKNFATQNEKATFGERNTFLLPDNSEVVLNAGSEINFTKWNWDNHRHLELNGEAFFKVAKGKRFEVQTQLGTVSVLGTQFNVKARKNRFDVVCYEGRVKVNYRKTQLLLEQGQSVSFDNGKQMNISTNEIKPEWLNNQMAFYKENLASLVDEVSRQYNVSIELNTADTTSLFTGKLPTKNLDVALQIISTTYNLEMRIISKNKIIFDEK